MVRNKFGFWMVASGLLGLIPVAHASEDTDTLPRGIFRARVVGVFTETVADKYNGNGELMGLADSLNRSVTINDFVAKNPQLGSLVNALNTLQPGMGYALGNTNLYAESTQKITSYMPALEYGVTDRLTIGIRMPIVHRTAKNSFRADSVNNAAAINGLMGQLSPSITDGLWKFDGQTFNTAFFEKSVFTDKGYDAPADFDKTEQGDLETGAKWNFYRTDTYSIAAQLGLRVPTGSSASLTNIYDKGTGGGSWANAATVYQDFYATPWLTFGTMAKGFYFYPDTRNRAVPKDASDSLPSLLESDGQVQMTKRSPGLEFQGELSSTQQFFDKKFSTWVALQMTAHGADKFEGPGGLYYEGLSTGTNFVKRNLEVGASLFTVPWFRKKEFPVPGRINLMYNTTLSGVNTSLVSYVRTDLIVYF